MPKPPADSLLDDCHRFDCEGLGRLISRVLSQGFRLIGPTARDNALILDDVESLEDLKPGWRDAQEPGRYRLSPGKGVAYFDQAVGPHSWKKYLHPPKVRLGSYDREIRSCTEQEENGPRKPLAFLGIRPCDVQAIRIQDRVFLSGPFIDKTYQSNRRDLLVIAVNCTYPSDTCFCTSMGSGPVAQEGFDLCLTEVTGKQKHYFLCQAGTKVGKKLVSDLGFEKAQETDILPALEAVQQAEKKIKRKLNTRDLPEILNRNFDHPRWEKTAQRCLSCGNCTMVCPTCFCVTVEETTDLTGSVAERWRRWDSCFTADFSYIHGGGVRQSTKSRYRQWMSHKLSHWVEQFGSLGCVGCGRCLTWCPVGIDITEEAAFIREHDQALQSKKKTMEAGHEDD